MPNPINDFITVKLKMSRRALDLLGGLANVPTGAIAVRAMDVVKDTVVHKYLNGEGVSKSWKPLSAAYAAWKAQAAPGEPKLVLGGALRSAVDNAPVEEIPDGARMTIKASEIPYARIHQYGGRCGRGHRTVMPRRTYLQVADLETKKAISAAAMDALIEAARAVHQGDVGAWEDLLRQGIRARVGTGSSKTALAILKRERRARQLAKAGRFVRRMKRRYKVASKIRAAKSAYKRAGRNARRGVRKLTKWLTKLAGSAGSGGK